VDSLFQTDKYRFTRLTGSSIRIFSDHIRQTAFESIPGLTESGYAFLFGSILNGASGVFAYSKSGRLIALVILSLKVDMLRNEHFFVLDALKSFKRMTEHEIKDLLSNILATAEVVMVKKIYTSVRKVSHSAVARRLGWVQDNTLRIDV